MKPMTLRIFQGQIADQCEQLLAEADSAQKALNEMGSHPDFRQCMQDFWRANQNLLVAAANVAKALWGSGGKRVAERADLRESLAVADTSVLKSSPILRNHFEHFDERIEEWEQKSTRHWFVDRNVGNMKNLISPQPDEVEVFRHYDPTTGELTFWGDSVVVRDLVAEAARILPIARAGASAPLQK
jgi:hypothetical protein